MAVNITRRPTVAVTNLAPPAFNGDAYFEISWNVPSIATDEERNDRFETTCIRFIWDARGEGVNTSTGKVQNPNVNAILTTGNLHPGSGLNQEPLNRTQYVDPSATSVGYYFDKNVLFPVYTNYDSGKNRATLFANKLTVQVYGHNSYGDGPVSETVYVFDNPKSFGRDIYEEHGFSEIEMSNNVITRSVEMYPGNDRYQRVDAQLILYRGIFPASAVKSPTTAVYTGNVMPRIRDGQSDLNTLISTYNDQHIGDLLSNQVLVYQWYLVERGYHGLTNEIVNFYVRYPPTPTIGKISLSEPNNLQGSTGFVTIPFTSKYKTDSLSNTNIVDRRNKLEPDVEYQLQQFKGAATLPTNPTWSDVSGASTNVSDSGFTDTYDNARPEIGNRLWYRVKATRTFGSTSFTTYSEPVEVSQFFRKAISAATDTAQIRSATSNDDGCGVTLVIDWKEQTGADITDAGMEISWSDFKDAWESNEPPSTLNVDWEGPSTPPTGYQKSATVTIRGLEEGTAYYIRARRYADYGTGTNYGPYAYLTESTSGAGVNSVEKSITPVSKITNLSLNLAGYRKYGEDLYLSWGYDSGTAQTQWKILWQTANSGNKELASSAGSEPDSKTYATIPWSKILGQVIPTVNSLTIPLQVSMTVGSEWASSEWQSVIYRMPPKITAELMSGSYVPQGTTKDGDIDVYKVNQQPIYFKFSCLYQDAIVTANLVSMGNSIYEPEGHTLQPDGMVLWTNTYKVTASTGVTVSYNSTTHLYDVSGASVYIPITDMRDNGRYRLEFTATDPQLKSNVSSTSIEIIPAWNISATSPASTSTVVIDDVAKTATITAQAGTGADSSDSVEIYRVTPDGVVKVLENGQFNTAYVDKYVPYSDMAELSYIIGARTLYRQVEWIEIPYTISPTIGWLRGEPFYTMRFDWGNGRYLEVPYNLEFQDSYNKDFEAKTNLDGTITGWWNSAIKKSKSLKTVAVKFSDPQQIALVRELAQYSGPVFIRTPDGDAFQADVQVSSLDNKYDGLTLSVSFKATALTLTNEFKMSL